MHSSRKWASSRRAAFGAPVINDFPVTNLPKWTGLLGATYESEPVYKEALVRASVDASYHSRENLNLNRAITRQWLEHAGRFVQLRAAADLRRAQFTLSGWGP